MMASSTFLDHVDDPFARSVQKRLDRTMRGQA
jgi:hypothetical protein